MEKILLAKLFKWNEKLTWSPDPTGKLEGTYEGLQLDQPHRAVVLKDWYMYIKAKVIAQFYQLWSGAPSGVHSSEDRTI